ncbi:hypothetical protein BDN71DRAFT_1594526 [Pleurotus eryngii]|uniref:Uncharacterized protein n=1 Tax=Pleurotus eryngii TaxID=5323 RepID=A0A9P5ZIU0_PLEER|nr:hypothetical protein BDN71DRAFT_1594526 [Pleurotus eryngii]
MIIDRRLLGRLASYGLLTKPGFTGMRRVRRSSAAWGSSSILASARNVAHHGKVFVNEVLPATFVTRNYSCAPSPPLYAVDPQLLRAPESSPPRSSPATIAAPRVLPSTVFTRNFCGPLSPPRYAVRPQLLLTPVAAAYYCPLPCLALARRDRLDGDLDARCESLIVGPNGPKDELVAELWDRID